jgi:DNA-binding NtrC family response regulator
MQVLLHYSWPGNIRELENAMERACVTTRSHVIELDNLPPDLLQTESAPAPATLDIDQPLTELIRKMTSSVEQQYIRKALEKSHGNVGLCAKLCGLSRRSISAKIAEYNINKATFKEV